MVSKQLPEAGGQVFMGTRITHWNRLRRMTILCLVILYAWSSVSVQAQDAARRLFQQWDRNQDGVLTIQEVPPRARRSFSSIDVNKDGRVTLQEHLSGGRQSRPAANKNAVPRWPEADITKLTVRQTWHQEPGGDDRVAFLSVPSRGQGKLPVVIFFHGNGGVAARVMNQWQYLNDNILVVPQGYRNSWNITDERSQAPDVQYVSQLISLVGEQCPRADMQNVTVIGSSNGSGLIHRLMIELDEKPFQSAILLSASLVTDQYHQGSFWMPSKTTSNYDTPKQPVPGTEVIYFHGTEDRVVPYKGGLRGGKQEHLSAQRTTFLWAKAFGFEGRQLPDSAGQMVEQGIVGYRYPEVKVVHYKLVGAGHGPGAYEKQVRSMIERAINH